MKVVYCLHIYLLLIVLLASSTVFAQAPKDGVVYCSDHSVVTMNPQRYNISTVASSISYALYDRMLKLDPVTKEVNPSIAKLLAISNHGRTYTFTVEHGINFHYNKLFTPTRPLNAYDIAFSFDRIINPKNPFHLPKREFPTFWRSGIANNLISVRATNARTVIFELNRPSSQLLPFLASDNAVLLSYEYAQKILDLGLSPQTIDVQAIGTGPFIMHRFVRDRFVQLHPFAGYYGQKPKIPLLVISRSMQTNKRLTQLFTHECHVITNPTPSQITLLENMTTEVNIMRRSNMIGTYLVFNTKQRILANKINRRTLASFINLTEMKNMVFFGHGYLNYELSQNNVNQDKQDTPKAHAKETQDPPNDNKYIEHPTIAPVSAYDEQLALLDLQRTHLRLFVFEQNSISANNHIKIAQIIKSDLENMGIQVDIKIFHGRAGLARLKSGRFDLAIINVFSDFETMAMPLIGCKNKISNTVDRNDFYHNFTGWCSEELDHLYSNLITSTNHAQAAGIYNDIASIIAEEMPIVPLIYTLNEVVAVTELKDLDMTPYGGIDFRKAYLTKDNQ